MPIHKALHSRDNIDMCQENKEEEDSPAIEIAPVHQ